MKFWDRKKFMIWKQLNCETLMTKGCFFGDGYKALEAFQFCQNFYKKLVELTTNH